MNENYFQTIKSSETEDWLDFHVIRPFCYYCARFFAHFDVHPNTVTIMSMFIGAGSCFFFAHGCYYYEGTSGLIYNLIAIFLLMWADIFDCTDGQLARMTGKKSRMGRILDGAAGFVWFIPIYMSLVYRFYLHHDLEFSWFCIDETQVNVLVTTCIVFILSLSSGFIGIGGQQRLADYYIQVHLFFLKGEKGSELDNSVRQKQIYDQLPADAPFYERFFQKSYVGYTRKQEKSTPQFQRLLARLQEKYGSVDRIPQEIREKIHSQSLALMPLNGLLTFNFRSFWLFVFCLSDIPALYFVFEIVCMGMLTKYINYRHESFCRRIADSIG